MTSGVYTITNMKNNKVYVGYSKNTERRLKEHKYALRNGTHHNLLLQRSFDKYGEDAFVFEHLECWNESVLPSMENYWCKLLSTHDPRFGFNMKPTDGVSGRGKHSEEAIMKMSIAGKGRTHTDESRIKMSIAHTGKTLSPETRLRIGAAGVKPVIDTETGLTYRSVKEAAKITGIKYRTLVSKLSGNRTNNTTLIYAA